MLLRQLTLKTLMVCLWQRDMGMEQVLADHASEMAQSHRAHDGIYHKLSVHLRTALLAGGEPNWSQPKS
jgi:hypothetical protein